MCIRDREEQEEGIFTEIKKHSEMTNNKGKIVEMKGVENKTVNRPNDRDDSVIVVVGNGRGTDQFQENKVDQVADNKVGLSNDEIEVSESVVIGGVQCNSKFEKDLMSMLVKQFDELKTKWNKQDEKWRLETDKLKENTGCLLYTSRCV